MFTGLVQGVGNVLRVEARSGDKHLTFQAAALSPAQKAGKAEGTNERSGTGLEVGESIAVNGVCLTAIEIEQGIFSADVSLETLAATTLGELQEGDAVNLERSLRFGQAVGGHLVTGHVDGVTELLAAKADGRSTQMTLAMPVRLACYVAAKGSVCIDGVSLTVNEVQSDRFMVNVVPHTLAVTTLGSCRAGARLNLEVDIIARYLERLASEGRFEPGRRQTQSRIDQDFLSKLGFGKEQS